MTGNLIVDAFILVGILGILAAVILYFMDKIFYVYEDPKIDEVAELLPSANCGGCGYAGCRNFAEAIIKAGKLDGFYCPAGGNDSMMAIAAVIGGAVEKMEPKIAVVRCNGNSDTSQPKVFYDSAMSCAFANSIYAGENMCPHSCLGCGDCVSACSFDAVYMDETTKLPVIIEEKCTACNACVKACPRQIIELRNKGIKSRRIHVSCVNKEKGAVAKKNCSAACIACTKCVKVCEFGAVEIKDNLAYIDYKKCKLCRKCAQECPTVAIIEVNFPARKEKIEESVS